MRTFTTILFTCLLSFSFTGAAYAQWVQTNGPYGGGVIAFMATDSDIFVSNRWSVFHSTNNGVNWSQVAADLPEFLNITSLAKVGANLFAGCDDMRGYGIFLSTDNGTTWTQTNNGLANLYVEVLACKDTNLFAGTDGGVFLSANNGKNWTAINNGLTNLYVHTLAITGTSIFAGTNGGGIFCSTDNGASWTPADSGLPTSNGSISSFCFSDTDIYCTMPGNYSVHGSGGVFRSTNNGTSWTSVNSNLPNWWATDAVFIENSYLFVSTCCEGIFLSTDLGTSWSLIESSPKGVPCFMVHGLYLFAGGMDGVYRSTDDGMTWAQVNQGMSLSITCVAVRGSSLYAGTRSGGIFLTTDDGTSWTHLSDCSGFIDALVVTDTTIVASNGGSQGHGPDGNIFLSTDNGESWTTINSNLTNTNAWALAISGPYIFAGTQGGGVFRTNNNGTSWTQVNSGLSNDTVRALAANDTNVFAGTQEGLSHSTDNGNSWSKIDIQVNSGQKFVSVGTLAMRGDSLFACTDQGAYFSIDNGTTWTAMPGASLMDILALAATNNYLFAGTSHSVWRAPISEVTDVRVFSQVLSMSYLLEQNYPNPFNPTTVISYQLPTNTLVALKVFDILGREVKTLVDERQSTGSHSVRFNATNLPSGVYFYRLEAGTYRDTEKMLLLK